jgi:hypothetical protein
VHVRSVGEAQEPKLRQARYDFLRGLLDTKTGGRGNGNLPDFQHNGLAELLRLYLRLCEMVRKAPILQS